VIPLPESESDMSDKAQQVRYRPQEAENKYYLTRWAELYFSRNRFTIERDQTSSLYFLNSDVQRAVIEQERKDNSIQNYVKDGSLPYVDVEVKNVILDDLRQSPYSARVEFEKVYSNPADHHGTQMGTMDSHCYLCLSGGREEQ
jgi:hypothetical protein